VESSLKINNHNEWKVNSHKHAAANVCEKINI